MSYDILDVPAISCSTLQKWFILELWLLQNTNIKNPVMEVKPTDQHK